MKTVGKHIEEKLRTLSAILDKGVIRLAPDDIENIIGECDKKGMEKAERDIEEKLMLLSAILDMYVIKLTSDDIEKAEVDYRVYVEFNNDMYYIRKCTEEERNM